MKVIGICEIMLQHIENKERERKGWWVGGMEEKRGRGGEIFS